MGNKTLKNFLEKNNIENTTKFDLSHSSQITRTAFLTPPPPVIKAPPGIIPKLDLNSEIKKTPPFSPKLIINEIEKSTSLQILKTPVLKTSMRPLPHVPKIQNIYDLEKSKIVNSSLIKELVLEEEKLEQDKIDKIKFLIDTYDELIKNLLKEEEKEFELISEKYKIQYEEFKKKNSEEEEDEFILNSEKYKSQTNDLKKKIKDDIKNLLG